MNETRKPDLEPARLWYFVGDHGEVSPMKVTPAQVHRAIQGGRLSPTVIQQMIAVVETAKAINRAMGRPELRGL